VYLATRSAGPSIDEEPAAPSDAAAERTDRSAVAALGLTSFFTDISTEMVTAVLPLFLVLHIGFDVADFGFFDGALAAATLVLLLAGGALADRWRRPKPVAFAGYALSAIARFGLVVTSAPILWLFGDRVGKGLRVAPRDALIAHSADRASVASAFAVHRMLDTAGAMLGPLIAFVVLWAVPGDFTLVFTISLIAAVVGLVVFWVGVPDARAQGSSSGPRLRLRDLEARGAVGRLSAAGALLGGATVSDGILYLIIWRTGDLDPSMFPLLFVGSALAYLVVAMPVGRLADRVGRVRLLVPAHIPLLGAYLVLALADAMTTPLILVVLMLHGFYFAMTDGIYAAAAAAITPAAARATGIATVTFGVAVGRFCASAAFGFVWLRWGLHSALAMAIVGLVVAMVAARPLLRSAMVRDER
jgi:MFS family permease